MTTHTKTIDADYLKVCFPDCYEAIREAMRDAIGREGDVEIQSLQIVAALTEPQEYWYGYDDEGICWQLGVEEIGIREAAATFESVAPAGRKLVKIELK